jgi:hypothetical protein
VLLRISIYSKTAHCRFYWTAISVVGQVGEGFLKGYPLRYDQRRQQKIFETQKQAGRLIDPADVPDTEPERVLIYDTVHEPGYGILLGLLWRVFNPGRYVVVMILQNLIGLLLAYLLFLQVSSLLRPWAAYGCLAAYLFFPPLLRFESHAYTYGWLSFATTATILIILRNGQNDTHQKKVAILYGAFLGICYWIRSVVLPLPFIAALSLVYLRGRKTATVTLLTSILAMGLVLAPMPFCARAIYKSWIPARLTFWHTVWVGFGQAENDFGASWSDGATEEMAFKERGLKPYTVEYEAYLKEKSLRVIREQPRFLLRLAWERLKLLGQGDWEPFEQRPFELLSRIVAIWSVVWIFLVFILRRDSPELRFARAIALTPLFILGFHFVMAVQTYYIWPAQTISFLGLMFLANRWYENRKQPS